MEKYKKLIASNPKGALIHASLDEKEADATKWARKAKFPWLTVFLAQHEVSGLDGFGEVMAGDSLLVDSNGKVLTRDENEAFAKIAGLK